ncbi:MAG: hypothetical protein AB7F59_08720 [Bdellovibrionales bacterium]
MAHHERLYMIFEKHLFQTPPEVEISTDDFVKEVIVEYIETLVQQGHIIPHHLKGELEKDLGEDVLDMTRKKTYGYLNIQEFRKNHKPLNHKSQN